MDNRTLSHTKWKCQYHFVFIPKYRKKSLYGKVRDDVREIISTLCKYKNVDIIIMCERGIRTSCTHVRNMIDIADIALIKNETNLPVVVDISHFLGRKDIIKTFSKAAIALGVGIMMEVHSYPKMF